MRAFAIAALVLVAACGTASNGHPGGTDGGGSNAADGGESTDAGTGGESTDAGTTPVCTDGDTQACTGSTDGSCDPGMRTCAGGQWGPCDGRVQPQPGLCDFPSCAGGENTGCACRVGTIRECHTQADSTVGHGICTAGFQECVQTATGSDWGDCEGEVKPLANDCTNRDLQCDSGAAPDCTCTTGEMRPCGGVTGGTCELGTQTCVSGKWSATCSGAVQPVKADCGDPSCLSTGGTMVPNPGCQCVIGESEACYTGPAGTETQGTCAAGTRTCDESGQWGPCLGQEHPLPTCDIPACTNATLSSCE